FSVPFAIATILVHGKSDLHAFGEQAVANPAVQALARRVFIVENPAYSRAYPELQQCELKIRLRDGSVAAGRCEVTKGEAAKPHDPQDLKRKFFTLSRMVWLEAHAESLYAALMALEQPGVFERLSSAASL